MIHVYSHYGWIGSQNIYPDLAQMFSSPFISKNLQLLGFVIEDLSGKIFSEEYHWLDYERKMHV